MTLRREAPQARVIVRDHKTIRPGTLSQILKAADLTVEALLELL
jgi:predicted RNA binding protein YcfA (HicA-like mRNA interferase family)